MKTLEKIGNNGVKVKIAALEGDVTERTEAATRGVL